MAEQNYLFILLFADSSVNNFQTKKNKELASREAVLVEALHSPRRTMMTRATQTMTI